jgi:aminopeptidase N
MSVVVVAAAAAAVAPKTAGRVLLPDTIVPSRYDLTIKPDLDAFTFDGECKIVLTTSNPTSNQIQLHAKELCFTSASFTVEGSNDAPVECEEVSSTCC